MKCAAPQYIDFVMSHTQKTICDESVFPTKYGMYINSSPPNMVRMEGAIWGEFGEVCDQLGVNAIYCVKFYKLTRSVVIEKSICTVSY